MNKSFIGIALFASLTITQAGQAGTFELISENPTGEPASHPGLKSSISSDGRYVAFSGYGLELVSGYSDLTTPSQIFVKDRTTQRITLISKSPSGVPADGISSDTPSISNNGQYVVFTSNSSNIVPDFRSTGDINSDVYLYNMSTGAINVISKNINGVSSNGSSGAPSISADGRYIAFYSNSEDLVTGGHIGYGEIFIHDRQTQTTSQVDLTSAGSTSTTRCHSKYPVISANGRHIVFLSDCELIAGQTNLGKKQAYVRNLDTGITIAVSVDSNGVYSNKDITNTPTISGDGRYAAFATRGDNLVVGDNANNIDIFTHDTQTGLTKSVSNSLNSTGLGDASSGFPLLTENGQYIFFSSIAKNLTSTAPLGSDIYRFDQFTGKTTRLYVENEANPTNSALFPSIAANGDYVCFWGIVDGASGVFITSMRGSSGLPASVKTDFNGDGKADVLWRNSSSGQNYLYLMDGITPTAYGGINTVGDLNWQIKGVDDFNGDGKADILWRHATTGQNYLYMMDGSAIVASGLVSTIADANWKIAGVGDFDGDSKADILWRNSSTGQNYLYLMDGATPKAYGGINTVGDLNWQIQGVDDFNGDSKADILWRHATTGQNYLYMMDGSAIIASGLVSTIADANWKIADVGDFDGDSKADILWRNSSTGQNYLYLMDGVTPKAYGGINTVSDLNWKIQNVDDFDGDGKADILWRHAATGENHLYIMDGSEITASGTINIVPDLGWEIK